MRFDLTYCYRNMSRLAVFAICALTMMFRPAAAEEPLMYLLGPGDLIAIQVYEEPELSLDMRVGFAGTITYPFLGEIQVSGMTPEQLETDIRDKLKGPYLINPSVVVSILEYRPFYVNGEVKKPGSYEYYPGMTIERAISIAGGFSDRASRSKIVVEHDVMSSEVEASKGSEVRVELSDNVMPGDVITVKQSFF